MLVTWQMKLLEMFKLLPPDTQHEMVKNNDSVFSTQ